MTMTAYSTAVGPLSSCRNARIRWNCFFIVSLSDITRRVSTSARMRLFQRIHAKPKDEAQKLSPPAIADCACVQVIRQRFECLLASSGAREKLVAINQRIRTRHCVDRNNGPVSIGKE